MHVSKIRLQNYSSFADTGWLELSPRLNVVIGQNNSGKSSFLAALGPLLPDRRHRDERSYLPGDLKPAEAELDICTTTAELRERLAETQRAVRTVGNGPSVADTDFLKTIINDERDITLKIACTGGQGPRSRESTFREFVRHDAGYQMGIELKNGEVVVTSQGGGSEDTIIEAYTAGEQPLFFQFNAQRLNIASYQFGAEKRLTSNASNLPSVLAYLSGNRPLVFEEIEHRVSEIIPGVSRIKVSTEDGNFKIIVWSDERANIRELAFDLDHSGTGVAQVIAIMTAVITSRPSVICIDEINSYLHPSAVKKLLRICTTFYSHHQYIVSSHSSDVISFHDIDRMFVIEKVGFVSSIKSVDRSDLREVRSAFRLLGIGMSDVLGSDKVVWVEGPTEELVFPELLKRVGYSIPDGTAFTAVAATGDFTRRGSSPKPVIDLYTAATSAVAPLVDGSTFILDRETLSDDAVVQIQRQTDGRLKLLPRRCIECFALDPKAISTVLNSELTSTSVTETEVHREIEVLAKDNVYGGVSRWNGDLTNEDWLKRVDAASLLKALFARLTENSIAFEKTKHTPRIFNEVPVENLGILVQLIRTSLASL